MNFHSLYNVIYFTQLCVECVILPHNLNRQNEQTVKILNILVILCIQ